MSTVRPTVFVVDDDVSVCDSLKLLAESLGWHSEAFVSGQAFLSRSPVPGPSCLVLDLLLPDFSGLHVQKLLADRTAMPIIFITGYGDVPSAVRAMKAGAMELLIKPVREDLLVSALRDALELSRAELEHAASLRGVQSCYALLSRREREVMALVVLGRLNKQVGAELGISEITVKAHRGSAMRKMKARTLPDLVMMAARLSGSIGKPSPTPA